MILVDKRRKLTRDLMGAVPRYRRGPRKGKALVYRTTKSAAVHAAIMQGADTLLVRRFSQSLLL